MTGYVRQSSFIDGDTILASDHNSEYNQIVSAFDEETGHAHDGTSSEGPVIGMIGDAGLTSPKNKIVVDSVNHRLGMFINVSGSTVEQIRVQDGAIVPVTDNDIDLGSSSLEFKNVYIDGTAYIDALDFGGVSITSILDQDDMSSNSDTALATQQSIKAYVDSINEFSPKLYVLNSGAQPPDFRLRHESGSLDEKVVRFRYSPPSVYFSFEADNELTTPNAFLKATRSGDNVDSIELGNATDTPAVTVHGPIGANGVSPPAQASHITDPSGGSTVDSEARTAINAILVVLENLGFTATS